MPLTEEVLGTNADGSKNEEYCMYCYREGIRIILASSYGRQMASDLSLS